jgi:hypothetical protein
MASPSLLGDLGAQIIGLGPASTSTAPFILATGGSDTGSVSNTGTRALDLAKPLHYSSTGGKPLDTTVNPEVLLGSIGSRLHSIGIDIPIEFTWHSSGKSIHVVVTHKQRSATSGAGSTWDTVATETFRFKGGTSTDVVTFPSVVSTIPTQAIERYYTADVKVWFWLASSTAGKDSSTDKNVIVMCPTYLGLAKSQPGQLNKV